MIVKYGSFSFDDNETMVSAFRAVRIYNQRGLPAVIRRQMVIEGEIIAANTAAIDARVQQIRSAFAIDGAAAGLYQSDGTPTQFQLPTAGSLGGVRIVEEPSFSLDDGRAHYATGLPFRVVLEADYPEVGGGGLVAYNETITRIGNGGPRRLTIELDNGVPAEQIVSTNTPVVILQSGEAVGFSAYPAFNTPILPAYVDLPDGYVTSAGAPQLSGTVFINYPIRWQYRMTLPTNITIPLPTPR